MFAQLLKPHKIAAQVRSLASITCAFPTYFMPSCWMRGRRRTSPHRDKQNTHTRNLQKKAIGNFKECNTRPVPITSALPKMESFQYHICQIRHKNNKPLCSILGFRYNKEKKLSGAERYPIRRQNFDDVNIRWGCITVGNGGLSREKKKRPEHVSSISILW